MLENPIPGSNKRKEEVPPLNRLAANRGSITPIGTTPRRHMLRESGSRTSLTAGRKSCPNPNRLPSCLGQSNPRQLLAHVPSWKRRKNSCGTGSLTLIFRLPLSNLFKTSQPLWYTIWGYVALALFLIGGIILLLIFYYVLGSYYRLTTQRFIRQRGFIARKIDYCELMRVRDMGVNQSFLDRIFDVGDLQILSSERLVPDIKVYGIRHPYRMLEEIRRRVMHSRAVRGVGILEVDK
jgi:hypothetical protein